LIKCSTLFGDAAVVLPDTIYCDSNNLSWEGKNWTSLKNSWVIIQHQKES